VSAKINALPVLAADATESQLSAESSETVWKDANEFFGVGSGRCRPFSFVPIGLRSR